MLIQSSEWLQIPKEERLLCIRLTVSENLERQRKIAYAKAIAKRKLLKHSSLNLR